MASTQINFRIPNNLKKDAQKKAQTMGLNLSDIMKIFLEKFVEENVLKIRIEKDIKWDKVFDQDVKDYYLSKEGKKKIANINKLIEEL